MNITYFKDTDTLYISLLDAPGSDAQEISPGVVVDFNEDGVPVGIEVDNASRNFNLNFKEELPLTIPFTIDDGNTQGKNV